MILSELPVGEYKIRFNVEAIRGRRYFHKTYITWVNEQDVLFSTITIERKKLSIYQILKIFE